MGLIAVLNLEMTLFLQLGKQVKKISYSGEISLPALNMLFLERFNYSSKQNDFPQIYIRDPQVGVSYELVDLTEIKNNAVLSLNIDGKVFINNYNNMSFNDNINIRKPRAKANPYRHADRIEPDV
jgi:hypothetical protein